MTRKLFLLLFILSFSTGIGSAQSFVKTSDIFRRSVNNSGAGQLNIFQDPAIDTLISRHIMVNRNIYRDRGYYGLKGYRIQIYSSSRRDAKEESAKVNAEFLDKFPESRFPELKSYTQFAQPAYYKIRVGDFRTKLEATKLFLLVSKEFPDSYLVPDIINFPDLNTK